MRAVMTLALLLPLAACDDVARPGSAATGSAREITAEQVEAERACAELTGYSAQAPRGMPEDKKALLQKEFAACVAAVTGGDKPALRGRAGDAEPAASDT